MRMTEEQADELIEGVEGCCDIKTNADIEKISKGSKANEDGYVVLMEGHGFTSRDSINLFYKDQKLYTNVIEYEPYYQVKYVEISTEKVINELDDIYDTFKRVYRTSNYNFLREVSKKVCIGIPMESGN